MKLMSSRLIAALAITITASSFAVATARAGTVIDDWAGIKAPPPPESENLAIPGDWEAAAIAAANEAEQQQQ